MRATVCATLALLVAGLSAGCVTRRVMITSDPPGALVYRDGQPIGPTPVEHPFVYYGKYRYRLVKDGYQPLDVEPKLYPPFYQWAGIDFITENLIPFHFRDLQVVHFQLAPLEAVRHDDVRARAEELRGRGSMIGPPPGVQPPRNNRDSAPPETLPPPMPAENVPVPLPPPQPTNRQQETAQKQAPASLPDKSPGVPNNTTKNAPPVRRATPVKGFATSPGASVTPSPTGGPSQ